MNNLVTVNKDNTATTTTLKIAETFGKRHDNVIRKLESLDLPKSFNALNFEEVKYTDTKGEERPMYNVTRDGMVFLTMGFTGKKAANFKIAYIEAFNKMEQHILSSKTKQVKVLNPDKVMKDYKRDTELRICHLRETLKEQQTSHRNDMRFMQEKNNKLVLDIVEKLKPVPAPKSGLKRSAQSNVTLKPKTVKTKSAPRQKFSMVDFLVNARKLKDMDDFNKRQTV